MRPHHVTTSPIALDHPRPSGQAIRVQVGPAKRVLNRERVSPLKPLFVGHDPPLGPVLLIVLYPPGGRRPSGSAAILKVVNLSKSSFYGPGPFCNLGTQQVSGDQLL